MGSGVPVGVGALVGVSVATATVVGVASRSLLTSAAVGSARFAVIQIAVRDIVTRVAKSRRPSRDTTERIAESKRPIIFLSLV